MSRFPHIAGTLSASSDEATWALTSYLVANGIVLTISGWLSDMLGRKRYFLICLDHVHGLLVSVRNGEQPRPSSSCSGSCRASSAAACSPTSNRSFSIPSRRKSAARRSAWRAIAIVVAPILGPTLGGIHHRHFDLALDILHQRAGRESSPSSSISLSSKIRRGRGTREAGASITSACRSSPSASAALQVMLDRGEDADWFNSSFIVAMAVLAFLGIGGAILWLLVAQRPIVHLEVFKDRNFTGGCVMIAATGAILYASAVIIPLLAQQVLGYTAEWSGLILSPGGVVVVMLIPIVGRLMNFVQTRLLIAFGFFVMGCALYYSSGLAPNIDFKTLVVMRSLQSAALAFLFVPIATVTYLTLPLRLRGDGAALFSMFRNVFGSIGISAATSLLTQRSQIRQSYLSEWASPFHQPFNDLVANYERTLAATGHAANSLQGVAVAKVYQMFRVQVSVMAYSDVFLVFSAVAFAVVPFCFMLSGKKASMSPDAAH